MINFDNKGNTRDERIALAIQWGVHGEANKARALEVSQRCEALADKYRALGDFNKAAFFSGLDCVAFRCYTGGAL